MADRIGKRAAFLFIFTLAFMIALGTLRSAHAAEPTNIALNKPASASSEESDEHAAAKANDGNPNTRWCANSGDTPQWWQVDLRGPSELTGAQIRWEMDGKTYQFIVEGSTDGAAWQTLSDQSNTNSNAQTLDLKFTASGIRFVRVRITGLDDGAWASMDEVKIFGTAPSVLESPAQPPKPVASVPEVVSVPKVFSHPDRIKYDGHCLTIDGKDILIFSGAFHYFRCPKELWADRFEKIKEAHFNAVETYVPWNWCESHQPKDPGDFSQVSLDDFRDWLRMAQDQFHLYTIVRPGPYICAEWEGGGYPRWLLNFKPATPSTAAFTQFYRTDNADYLKWCKHWYDAVCKVVAPEQITHKLVGSQGVILFQIENEYNYDNSVPRDGKIRQLQSLYQDAVSNGIDVPIFTCWTQQIRGSSDPLLSQAFDAINEYPRHALARVGADIARDQHQQPNAPVMISELQGGWFSNVGGQLSENQDGIEPEQTHAMTLGALRDGATILNYYMLFGGTNFGGWAGRGITTTYDYDAPIRECGGVSEKYHTVQAIGEMLQAWGPEIARSDRMASQNLDGGLNIAVRQATDGALFVFASRGFGRTGTSGVVDVKLADGRSVKISYDLTQTTAQVARIAPGASELVASEWQPRSIPDAKPPEVPDAVQITQVLMRPDEGALDWKRLEAGETFASIGIEEPRDVLYHTSVNLTADQLKILHLLHVDVYESDQGVADVNGAIVFLRGGRRHSLEADISSLLKPGPNEITVLYDDQGQANGGNDMQTAPGLSGGRLAASRTDTVGVPLTWQIADHLAGASQQWWSAASADRSQWKPMPLDSKDRSPMSTALVTWYRAAFELPASDPHEWVPWKARLDMAGDAYLYLNGHALGRYWDIGPQHEFYLPECWLNFGPGTTNNLTLIARPTIQGERIRAIKISPYAAFAESR